MRTFVPFEKIGSQKAIVVDALHPNALVLSHWKGGNIHPEIAADTSGEIVLNALKKDFNGLESKIVSANHFDIDGFVGVFALCYPELAKEYDEVLREMAIIGDFREYKVNSKTAELALKLCCWVNSREKENFYRPFGEKAEAKLCDNKFQYFLKLFPSVLENPEKFRADWVKEYEHTLSGIEKLNEKCQLTERKDLGIVIQKCQSPSHYYAQFSHSKGFDGVLSIYDDNRYEFEYKYTTWVDIVSRPTLPRINLKPLAKELNQIEKSDYVWEVDHITDTGPILRLEKDKISKADRFDSPSNRAIYSSSIPEDQFTELLTSYLENAYQDIDAKRFWTWDEIKQVNRRVLV